jgi:hypothetical protein
MRGVKMMIRYSAAVLLVLAPSLAGASTLCVNTGGTGGCLATIQQAVTAAGRGDVIDVAAGTYVENVVVPAAARFTLQGAGSAATLVDGNGSGWVFALHGLNTNVTMKGIGIQNGSRGIDVGDRARLTLSGCAITGNVGEGAVTLHPRANVTVTGCTISGNSNATEGGGAFSYVYFADAGSRLTIDASTVSGNSAEMGGGIFSFGDVTITDSTIAGNTATSGDGGGIWSNGLRMSGSVVSGNSAAQDGGGITGSGFNFRHRFLRVINSTISGNTAGNRGGGIGVIPQMRFEHVTVANNSAGNRGGGIGRAGFAETVVLKASIIADNSAPNGGADCDSTDLRAFNGNLIENSLFCAATLLGGGSILTADPLLGPLQGNGGPTATQALLAGSPAIGVVTNGALCKQHDQRGVARARPCDLGAYEAP